MDFDRFLIDRRLVSQVYRPLAPPRPDIPSVFHAFDLLGVDAKTIAWFLNVSRSAVHVWRRGQRPLPAKRRADLLDFLKYAIDCARKVSEREAEKPDLDVIAKARLLMYRSRIAHAEAILWTEK